MANRSGERTRNGRIGRGLAAKTPSGRWPRRPDQRRCITLRCHHRKPSLHTLQHLPRLTQQYQNLPSLRDRIPAEQSVLVRVPVRPRRAGSLGTAVHAAARLAVHGMRPARAAAAGLGATTRARQHRAGILDVIAHACASGLASAAPCRRLAPAGPSARAADAGFWSDTTTFACCVTLPTMALPPPSTFTFCTVTSPTGRQLEREGYFLSRTQGAHRVGAGSLQGLARMDGPVDLP